MEKKFSMLMTIFILLLSACTQAPTPAPDHIDKSIDTPVDKPVDKPVEVKPATEPAPTTIQVALSSNPEGAELFLGETSLGEAPTIAEIPISSEPVTLTAKFPDGSTTTQTIVPDRPIPHIAFSEPRKPAAVKPPSGASRHTTDTSSATKRPSSSGTIKDRDGTMDPFQ